MTKTKDETKNEKRFSKRFKTYDAYLKNKAEASASSRKRSFDGRNIGAIPEIVDPERRESCRLDFLKFCEKYHSDLLTIKLSPVHLKVIETIQNSILHGGYYAMALPRSSGKTMYSVMGAEWAALYGHSSFIFLIGASADKAKEMFNTIKIDVETNEAIKEDFPEVCYPIERLEGSNGRCKGQHIDGERTRITWTDRELIFPTVKGSVSSGCVVRASGIFGRIRGTYYTRPSDGSRVRPDLAIVDDPQTTESAHSTTQVNKILDVVDKDIMYLGSPTKKYTVLIPMTIICHRDAAEQLLDPKKRPKFKGAKYKALVSFPKNMDLWGKYKVTLDQDYQNGGNGEAATEFYRKNREKMDEGAEVYWNERFIDPEISGLQHCMNRFYESPSAFMSEFQQEPASNNNDDEQLKVEDVYAKLNNRERYVVPEFCTRVTAFIDVQGSVLFYVVVAWDENFTGCVVDYGTWPNQNSRQFDLGNLTNTYQKEMPNAGFEGQLRHALDSLATQILGREYKRNIDGAPMKISRCLVDANWNPSTEVVERFVVESKFSNVLTASKGLSYVASRAPMSERPRKRGEIVGLNWFLSNKINPYLFYDTNYWKTFIFNRIKTCLGDVGSLTIFGDDSYFHQLYAEHLCAEYFSDVTCGERQVKEWNLRPGIKRNDWFDCTVGAAVAANFSGLVFKDAEAGVSKRKEKSFEEIYKENKDVYLN